MRQTIWANRRQLAACLGITWRRVNVLKSEVGLFSGAGATKHEGRAVLYDLKMCIAEYLAYKINLAEKSEGAADREKEQAEHERIKKQISALRLKKLRSRLHEADDVESCVTNMLMAIRSRLQVIPKAAAAEIVGVDDFDFIRKKLEENVVSALKDIAELDPSQCLEEYSS